jgi:hypothetical protein
MRRSAAALLARPAPPSSPAPEGLEAVQAAAAEAMRAVEWKFAAVRAAVPSLVLAAPSLKIPPALLSPAFSSSAPELPVLAATGHTASTPCDTRHAPSRRAVLSAAFSSSAPELSVAAAEAPSQVCAGGDRAVLLWSKCGGNLPRIPSGSRGGFEGGACATGESQLSPRGAGPMLSRSGPGQFLRAASDCSHGPGGDRARAVANPAAVAAAAWPPAGVAGRRASLVGIAYAPRRPGEERPFAQAARGAGEATRPARP